MHPFSIQVVPREKNPIFISGTVYGLSKKCGGEI
jgi:hypothetical protein